MPRPNSRERVFKAFFEMENDSTPEEIADKAGVTKRTAKKWISQLEEIGKIKQTRTIGRTKLYELASEIEVDKQDEIKAEH